MRFFNRSHFLETKGKKKIYRIAIYLFIAYIAFAAISSVWSVYIDGLLKNDAYVGFSVSFLTVISFLSFFLIIPLIEKNDKLHLTYIAYFFSVIAYVFFFFNSNFWLFLAVASCLMVFNTIRISSTGIIIEKNSSRKNLARNEGFIYTIYNLAFFVGPLLGFFVASVMGIDFVFLISAFFLLISIYILKTSKINHGGKRKKVHLNPFKNFIEFFKSRDRMFSYTLGAGVNFWWSLVYVYIPLYIIKYLDKYWVGIFLSLVVVPLFLFEFYFAKRAGEFGYKKYFFRGYLFAGLIAFLCFFIFEVWFVVFALVIASVGLAMLESTTEAYFFDILKEKEDHRFYPPYNTAINTGAFLGQIIPAFVLLFFDFRYIFLVYGFGMLLLAFLSLKVKNVFEKRRKGGFK